MSELPRFAASRASRVSSPVLPELWALRSAVETISSSVALVSSIEAACWLAPAANCWLAAETWCAEAAVSSAPAMSVSTMRVSTRLVLRVIRNATTEPISPARMLPTTNVFMPRCRPVALSSDISRIRRTALAKIFSTSSTNGKYAAERAARLASLASIAVSSVASPSW